MSAVRLLAGTAAAAAALTLAACGGGSGSASGSASASAPAPAAASPSAPAAADVAGAEAFLRQALARYASADAYAAAERDQAARDAEATPAGTARLFTPALAARVDRAYAREGGPGAMPLTLVQDDAGMLVRSITSEAQPDGRVQSTVSFGDGPGVTIYTLEQTPAGWRIADVVDRGRPGNEGDVRLTDMLASGEAG